MTGRPSSFTKPVAADICDKLSQGQSLRSICSAEDMPDKSTVMRWLADRPEFRDQYARAREAQADYWAEEIIEISDDDSQDAIVDPESGNARQNTEFVARSRLRVDTRKWLMARMAPKKYGERVMQEVTGAEGGPVQIQKIERVIVNSKNTDG